MDSQEISRRGFLTRTGLAGAGLLPKRKSGREPNRRAVYSTPDPHGGLFLSPTPFPRHGPWWGRGPWRAPAPRSRERDPGPGPGILVHDGRGEPVRPSTLRRLFLLPIV